jgi:NAD(P)-dependent dehydrogenase (short-subunit alcohol dehydrogenase family)
LKGKKINNGASLVFLSSVAVNHPYNGSALYSASKAAIEAYSKSLALELHTQKIRSNCIVPAMVNTSIYQETVKHGMYGSNANEYKNKYLLGIGEPEDIANASIYLLSEASRWVTGTNIFLDGGYSLLK